MTSATDKVAFELNPFDLVDRIASANTASDLVHIQRLVRRAVLGDDREYLEAFIDQTTAACFRKYMAREAERATATLRPKPTMVSNSSEKFVAPNRPGPTSAPVVTTPRLNPDRVPPSAPTTYSERKPTTPTPAIRSIAIPERAPDRIPTLRNHQAARSVTATNTVTPRRDAADLHFKRARAFLVGSLLNLLMPNGKKLGDCTLRECDQFGSWFKGIRQAAKNAPLDAPVSLYFTDEKLRKIQTWTADVYAD